MGSVAEESSTRNLKYMEKVLEDRPPEMCTLSGVLWICTC